MASNTDTRVEPRASAPDDSACPARSRRQASKGSAKDSLNVGNLISDGLSASKFHSPIQRTNAGDPSDSWLLLFRSASPKMDPGKWHASRVFITFPSRDLATETDRKVDRESIRERGLKQCPSVGSLRSQWGVNELRNESTDVTMTSRWDRLQQSITRNSTHDERRTGFSRFNWETGDDMGIGDIRHASPTRCMTIERVRVLW